MGSDGVKNGYFFFLIYNSLFVIFHTFHWSITSPFDRCRFGESFKLLGGQLKCHYLYVKTGAPIERIYSNMTISGDPFRGWGMLILIKIKV